MRYIIIANCYEKNNFVFVIFARSQFNANRIANLKMSKYKNVKILSMRKIYNPMYSFDTAYFFKDIVVPEKDMNKYLYWDNNETGLEFNFYT